MVKISRCCCNSLLFIFVFVSSTTKILIIRFSSIGDIVLTTPVIRCLKNQFKGDVELHYLTKEHYKVILENNPYLNGVHTIKKSTNEIINTLKALKFDYVIDLHKNLRSKRIIKNLKCVAFSFNKLNYEKWLFTTFKINKLPKVHIVDRYLETLKHFDVENDHQGLDYFIGEEGQVEIAELPLTHHSGFVAFAIGAQHFTKRLPTHKIIAICKKIAQPVILLGGKEDVETANEIIQSVGLNAYNGCGKFSLHQSASIIAQSKTLITHDTGLMHIGVALGVNIVSVWGNTVPAFGMYPYYPNQPQKYTIVENEDLKCRPCSKIGHQKCPKKHFKCMEDIDDMAVVRGIQS